MGQDHFSVALCAPAVRTVVIEAYAFDDTSSGEFRINRESHPVVAITASGAGSPITYDYVVHHQHLGLITMGDLMYRIPGAVYATLVCPGPESADRQRIDKAIKEAAERATANYKEMKGNR